jgi:hypothetical protein
MSTTSESASAIRFGFFLWAVIFLLGIAAAVASAWFYYVDAVPKAIYWLLVGVLLNRAAGAISERVDEMEKQQAAESGGAS